MTDADRAQIMHPSRLWADGEQLVLLRRLLADRDRLAGEVERLTEERDDARHCEPNAWEHLLSSERSAHEQVRNMEATVTRLTAENAELRTKLDYTYCAFCGHKTPVNDATAEKITDHVLECPKHPMRVLAAENERLQRGDFTPEEFQGLCHHQDEKPGCEASDFYDGCHLYQQKLFGASERDFYEAMKGGVAQRIAGLEATVSRLRESLSATLSELGTQARLRGEAEGALLASSWPSTVQGWMDRAAAAEQDNERLRNMAREITCVWCGHQFVTKLQSQAAELYEHAKTCEKHPVSRLRAELGRVVETCPRCGGEGFIPPPRDVQAYNVTGQPCKHCGPARRLLAEGGES